MGVISFLYSSLKITNMSYEKKQQELAKEMQELSGRLESFTKSKEYSKGYSECKKEYEEKLSFVSVHERLPKNDKYVEVKDSTGDWDKAYWDNDKELWVFQNSFSNLSHVVEWRSFL